MTIQLLFAGVPVTDLDVAIEWYERVFGRPPDVLVHDDEVMWNVAPTGWVYVLRSPDRAGRALVTLSVDNLDGLVAELAGRGVEGSGIELVGDAGRRATFTDPDGNTVDFIEVASA